MYTSCVTVSDLLAIPQCAVSRQLGGCPLSGESSMCMMCLKYTITLFIVIKKNREYETPRSMKTNFIDKNRPLCVVVRSCA